MDSKVKSIDEHLYNPARTEQQYVVTSARRLAPRTSLRYRLSKLNQPGGFFNLSGNTFNPHARTWALIFLAITSVLAGGVLAQGALFHSYQQGHVAPSDPYTLIWDNPDTAHNLGGFACQSASSPCNGVFQGNDIVKLQPTSTGAAIAISQGTIDLSTISAKQLLMEQSWVISGSFAFNKLWGWFLTTNGTLPTPNTAYDPATDPSVTFLVETIGTSSNTFTTDIRFTRTLGVKDTIGLEDTGICNQSGSCYTSTSFHDTNYALNWQDELYFLNFTGAGSKTTNCSGSTNSLSGPNCSWQYHYENGGGGTNITSTQTQPWFNFQSQQFHYGLWVQAGFDNGVSAMVDFSFDQSSLAIGTGNLAGLPLNGVMAFYTFTPAATTQVPTYDTGGFFGPIIRFFVSAGVFFLANVIGFFTYIWSLIQPLFNIIVTTLISILASIAAIVITVIKAVLNAIGTGLGISALGDNLFTFLGDIAGFFTTFFGNSLAQLSSFITFLTNGYSTISASFGTYWTDLTNWTSGIKDLLAGLWVIGGQLFTISFAFMFSGWLLFGAKKFSDSVGEGMEWFNLTRQFVMIGVALALFLFTMILHYVIIPVFHAVTATGEAKQTAEPDVVIGGTGVG